MPVNPKIQFFLDKLNALPKTPLDEITPEAYRAMETESIKNLPQLEEPVKKVEDRVLKLKGRDIPVRVYTPNKGTAPHPGLVYYHGGGWVLGDLESHDAVCRFLANTASCVVISVDYRLAPESKFPAAVDDAYDSLEWIVEHEEEFAIDRSRIAVGGDSAGGNLAAVACIIAKERKAPEICHQLLLYPSTGFKEEPPSLKENAEGYFLTAESMEWFRKHYFNSDDDMLHPYASPILYHDLSGLPSATILTAQYDPLRDVGKAYAEQLEVNGVNVVYKNYEDLIHGFANFAGFVPEAKDALEDGARSLEKAFASSK
ncbi:alpha/beta hydrolase [Lentibacillus sp. Marseille-P4043]|uniref:alpha/beta hydrolase n=1 Tax=Lentibacillus sp. Marseille-P4043 TaxID=2040293 RepID=UPI000D0B7054|nr:alpha/beta hydrolase [Lentibacillus sp. Marseille-P4043]